MSAPIIRGRKYHGMADLGMSRYVTLYITQLGWLLLGLYFLRNAWWPSSCSPRLPESRHFMETALFTWLWTTPILILLDVSRRYQAWADKRAK
jgi:hypothetical protein